MLCRSAIEARSVRPWCAARAPCAASRFSLKIRVCGWRPPHRGYIAWSSGGELMRRVTRRRFLQVSGAAAAQAGGIAAILASGRAPAYAQQTTLHWLRWNDFVPASDQLLGEQFAPQFEKDPGI